ncbi:MAG TPA: hypothetical protein VKT70_06110, partial [Stellaceae bacterium]|nr:hypothetical protein [Stellaceae bacterium]
NTAIIGDTGFSVPPRDATALARAIGTMIDNGPDYRRHLGTHARQRVIDHYSLSAIAERYRTFFEQHSRGGS